MKLIVPFIFLLALGSTARAQLFVFDPANLAQATIQYGALVHQISNQAAQISNQIQQIQQLTTQIRQFDTQLSRLGDMSAIKNLIGFGQLREDLSLPTQLEAWADRLKKVDGSKILQDSRGGLYTVLTTTFEDFDGATVERETERYKSTEVVIANVDNFVAVQKDILTRRAELKKAIEVTTDAVRNAATVAEEQKQQAILEAQYDQLASLDSEIQISAAEIRAKVAEADAMKKAQDKAESETRSHMNQQEGDKVSKAYTPYYGCMLQYVKEKKMPVLAKKTL